MMNEIADEGRWMMDDGGGQQMNVWRELWAALRDARRCGDLRGHLAAWWAVAAGRVTAGQRIEAVR